MKIILTLGIAAFAGRVFAADTLSPLFDVRSYGAKGDGVALDSPAVDKAIAAAHAAGGGIVWLPAGTWLSGTIHLKSNVTLDLSPGATLLATADTAAYDRPEPNDWDKYQDFGHSHFRKQPDLGRRTREHRDCRNWTHLG